MTRSQKIAISYAIAARAKKRREAFIIEKEGSLDGFKKSKYKTMTWYIIAKYDVRIY